MRYASRLPLVCSIVVLCTFVAQSPAAEPDKTTTKTPAKTKLGIIISKDTTYITAPLNADGTVNYVAYLNAKYSKGVTKDNNAAIAMLRALGPDILTDSEKLRARYYAALNIKPLPEKGNYLVSLNSFLERKGFDDKEIASIKADLSDARKSPWQAKEFPEVAEWIKINEVPLSSLIAGSKKPSCRVPSLTPSDPPVFFDILLPRFNPHRYAMKALAARAMLKTNSGDWTGARADLMAIGRWARLMSQGPTIIERLVGLAEESLRIDALAGLVTDTKMTESQAKALLADMDALAPLPDMREAIANERFVLLDSVMLLTRLKIHGKDRSKYNEDFPDKFQITKLRAISRSGKVDWNITLRICNEWYDKTIAVAAAQTTRERNAASDRFEKERAALSGQLLKSKPLLERIVKNAGKDSPDNDATPVDPKVLSTVFGKMLVAILLPDTGRAVTLQERTAMNRDLARVGLALAAMRASTGKFPAKLAELSPKYLKTIPRDVFSGKDLIYKRRRRGYVLYSVGENLKDDRGRTKGDLVIRVK